MTATRSRLPPRRKNETADLVFEGTRYHATVGFTSDGEAREVFCHGAKVGSGMDRLIDDACVMLSLLLQHGVQPRELVRSMGRLDDGSPASIIGALADLVASYDNTKQHLPNS